MSKLGGMKENESGLFMSGVEWRHLCSLISMVLAYDDSFRKATRKTLLWNRGWVETSQQELKRVVEGKGTWLVYVMSPGRDHPIVIKTREPDRANDVLFADEQILMCVPQEVRVKATQEVLLGIANACCKAVALHDAMKELGREDVLTDFGYSLAKKFWERCHLHWRRSVGARKAAWRRKGYIAKYDKVPDFREAEFHEGSKLLYDLDEEAKNE